MTRRIAFTLCLLLPSVAAAENRDLAAARKFVQEMRVERANQSLRKALRTGKNSRADMVEIYRLLAEVAAVLNQTDKATAYYKQLLAIQPDYALPASTSPRFSQLFDDAKQEAVQNTPLEFEASIETQADKKSRRVVVRITKDVFKLTSGAAFEIDADGQTTTASRLGLNIALDLPEAELLQVKLSIRDKYGNTLRTKELEARSTKRPPEHVKIPKPSQPASLAFYQKWWVWGSAAVVFAGVGASFGMLAKTANDDLQTLIDNSAMHDYSDAKALEDKARQRALFANIGFAAAGVAAGVGAYMLFAHRGSDSREVPAVTAAPTNGGAAVFLQLGF